MSTGLAWASETGTAFRLAAAKAGAADRRVAGEDGRVEISFITTTAPGGMDESGVEGRGPSKFSRARSD